MKKHSVPFDLPQAHLPPPLPRCLLSGLHSPPSSPRDNKGCYLTRSMTLSRGTSLTVSSLMAKIWSPGRSLPKEGPSADGTGHAAKNVNSFTHVIMICATSKSICSLITHTHKFCTRQGCQTIKVFNLINHSVGSDYSRLIMVDWGKSTFLNMTKNKYVYWCKRKRNNLKWKPPQRWHFKLVMPHWKEKFPHSVFKCHFVGGMFVHTVCVCVILPSLIQLS